MKIVCSVCSRYYEDISREPDANLPSGSVSHGICARCNVLYYSDIYDNDDERREVIKEEIDKGIIWLGEDKSKFSDEKKLLYKKLFDEVQASRGEGGFDKR